MWILWAKSLLPNSGLLAVEESPWGVKKKQHTPTYLGEKAEIIMLLI